LRHHFEVDYKHIVVAALAELAKRGELDGKVAASAIEKYGINVDRINPLHA
jgi:pyruvate dehydrogenase E1 component